MSYYSKVLVVKPDDPTSTNPCIPHGGRRKLSLLYFSHNHMNAMVYTQKHEHTPTYKNTYTYLQTNKYRGKWNILRRGEVIFWQQ